MKNKSKPIITVEQLYESLKYTNRVDDNLFEVSEVETMLKELCKALPEDLDENDRLFNMLTELVEQAERNAFKIGFCVAKGLLATER
ncbi:MAG: hypothetical protein J6X85_02985 [Ruminococcus sp.]|nr:hypothetical protein [Ruminococcus sp.]